MDGIFVNNLKKTFGNVTAVDIPDLKIEKGDLIGLVGNNGAGKTTLLRLMLDLAEPDSGSVTLRGVNPHDNDEWKKWTGAYLDDGFLIDFLTPEEYFEFIAKVNDMTADALRDRLADMSKFMGGEILSQNKYIREFSAGNKQKIGIIGAMIASPEVLILDEPFNFLDPTGQERLKELLLDYHRKTGATIIVSSHNLHYVVDTSTRILVMESGHIVKDIANDNGNAAEVLKDYFAD